MAYEYEHTKEYKFKYKNDKSFSLKGQKEEIWIEAKL